MDVDPAQRLAPVTIVQSVEGAGERNSLRARQHDEAKDGDNSVCFERMGMGDLEAVELADAVSQPAAALIPGSGSRPRAGGPPILTTEAWPARSLEPPSMSCCFTECTPADSSDDDDDVGLLDAVDHNAHLEATGRPRAPTPAPTQSARSKLSITNVSLISLPASARPAEVDVHVAQAVLGEGPDRGRAVGETAAALASGQYDDVEESEDETTLRAPTPDNTPDHSPPGEAYPGLASEPDSALLSSTLNDIVTSGVARAQGYGSSGTPSPDATPQASPEASPAATLGRSVSTLGRVWSRILGRGGSGSKKAAPASPSPPAATAHPPRRADSEEDEDDSEHLSALEVDSHTIDELEATLEEVRLDGDGDDPVVSYLVEEVEDVARPQAAVSGEVTVEEVHDEESDDEDGGEDAEDPALVEPTLRPSGLLSRLFSRSRTSQDVSSSEPGVLEAEGSRAPTEPVEPASRAARAKERALKRGKTDASSRDRLHRLKPRQSNKAAVRGSLPRILSRWLRQAEARAEAGGWGAEGDAGEAVVGGVSPRLGLGPRLARGRGAAAAAAQRAQQPGQPPALHRTRRAQPLLESRDIRALKNLNEESINVKHQSACSVKEEKLVADFGGQAGESMLPNSSSFLSQESRGTEATLISVTDTSDFI